MGNKFKSEYYWAIKDKKSEKYLGVGVNYYFEEVVVNFLFQLNTKKIITNIQANINIREDYFYEALAKLQEEFKGNIKASAEKITMDKFKQIIMEGNLQEDFLEKVCEYKENNLIEHVMKVLDIK